MTTFDLILTVARTAISLLALAVLAWGFFHWRNAQRRDTQRLFEQLDLMRSELMSLSDQVAVLQSRPTVEVLHAPAPAPEPVRPIITPPPASARGYEVAARLARSGASTEELMSSCGLSRHEAELLLRLHKGATTSAPPVARVAPAPRAVAEKVPAATPRSRPSISLVG